MIAALGSASPVSVTLAGSTGGPCDECARDVKEARARAPGQAAELSISPAARERARLEADRLELPGSEAAEKSRGARAKAAEADEAGPAPEDPRELSPEEQQDVDELRKRDAEVRTHEQAHKSTGGQYAGAIHYEYQGGPDGKRYAVGGHVPIDVAPVAGDPAATLRKMTIVQRAALAPAEPSAADRQVAARAASEAARARSEVAKDRLESSQASDKPLPQAAAEPSSEVPNAARAEEFSNHPRSPHPRLNLVA